MTNPLLPSFHDTYRLSMSSLRCKSLWIVIYHLVFCSICLSSFLVHFKNGREYLARKTAKALIPWMIFRQKILVSRTFLVRLKCSRGGRYWFNFSSDFLCTCWFAFSRGDITSKVYELQKLAIYYNDKNKLQV